MKVLLVAPYPPPEGGIATWTRILLSELEKYPDLEVVLIDVNTRWRSYVNRSRLLRLLGGSIKSSYDFARTKLALLCHRHDVLHYTTAGDFAAPRDILTMLAARLLRTRSIIHYRTGQLSDFFRRSALLRVLTHWSVLLADEVMVLDERTERFIRSRYPRKSVVRIPNMVDLDALEQCLRGDSAATKGQKKIAYVGWIIPEKGIRELVEACREFAGTDLQLIGPVAGSFRDELEKLASPHENGTWLKIPGRLPHGEAMRLLATADIFCLPSYTEGFPNVIMEAMAFGLPIVTTPVGAIPEMLDIEGEHPCGICVTPRQVEPLREVLRSLLDNPSRGAELGAAARERVRRMYSSATVTKRLVVHWRSSFNDAGN